MSKNLSRKADHRRLMVRNILTSLVLYEKVDTTKAKSKVLKSQFDRIIARSKKADLAVRRNLEGILLDKSAVKKVIEELVPRYAGRKSGFARSYHLKNRLGDNSRMVRIELVDKKVFVTKEEGESEKVEDKNETKDTKKTKDVDVMIKEPKKAKNDKQGK
ncbi:MAG: 50S ribosomal protein L17 [Patescibacteria group bacterium]